VACIVGARIQSLWAGAAARAQRGRLVMAMVDEGDEETIWLAEGSSALWRCTQHPLLKWGERWVDAPKGGAQLHPASCFISQ